MIDFSELFRESDGEPITYNGKTCAMWDQFHLPGHHSKLKYRILSTNSEWRQGIAFSTDGSLIFEDGDAVLKGWALIWEEDRPPFEEEFLCRSKNLLLDLKNVWDRGGSVVDSWINGAAIWIKEIPNGRRYHCNDGHFDDDFDDIIFEISIVNKEFPVILYSTKCTNKPFEQMLKQYLWKPRGLFNFMEPLFSSTKYGEDLNLLTIEFVSHDAKSSEGNSGYPKLSNYDKKLKEIKALFEVSRRRFSKLTPPQRRQFIVKTTFEAIEMTERRLGKRKLDIDFRRLRHDVQKAAEEYLTQK